MVYGEKQLDSSFAFAANVAADEESRMDRREQEWKLDSDIFHKGPFLLGVNDMMDPVCFLA